MAVATNLLAMKHALTAVDGKRSKEAASRRNAVFDIETHDPRGDSLLDELATEFHQRLSTILENFEMGDDLANGVVIRRVIYQVADAIHAKHWEEER